jgi:hypothetical protein
MVKSFNEEGGFAEALEYSIEERANANALP